MYFYYEKRRNRPKDFCYRAGEDLHKIGENLYNQLTEYRSTVVGRIDEDDFLGYPDLESFGKSIDPDNMPLLRLYDILCDYEGMACTYPLWYVISEEGADVEVVNSTDKIDFFELYMEEVYGVDFEVPPCIYSDSDFTPGQADLRGMYALGRELRKYKEEQEQVE